MNTNIEVDTARLDMNVAELKKRLEVAKAADDEHIAQYGEAPEWGTLVVLPQGGIEALLDILDVERQPTRLATLPPHKGATVIDEFVNVCVAYMVEVQAHATQLVNEDPTDVNHKLASVMDATARVYPVLAPGACAEAQAGELYT